MTPRHATEIDIPAMVAMGRKFHAMSPHTGLGEFDASAVASMLRFMIAAPSALLLTNGDGILGGVMAPVYFQPGTLMMEESFWWASGGGQELREAFETEAKRMGARFVLFSTLENERIAAIDRVMRRNGYTPIERRYLKELN